MAADRTCTSVSPRPTAAPRLQALTQESEVTDRPPLEWVRLYDAHRCVVMAKVRRSLRRAVVHFITTHPDYRNGGLARHLVSTLQQGRDEVIARGVSFEARGFWVRIGFTRVPDSQDYRWRTDDRASRGTP